MVSWDASNLELGAVNVNELHHFLSKQHDGRWMGAQLPICPALIDQTRKISQDPALTSVSSGNSATNLTYAHLLLSRGGFSGLAIVDNIIPISYLKKSDKTFGGGLAQLPKAASVDILFGVAILLIRQVKISIASDHVSRPWLFSRGLPPEVLRWQSWRNSSAQLVGE